MIIGNLTLDPNQHVKMIFEGSCDTEDEYDAEKSGINSLKINANIKMKSREIKTRKR